MKTRTIGTALLVASLMTVTTLAQAHPHERGMMMGDGSSGMGMRGSMMDMMMGAGASGRGGMTGDMMGGDMMGMGLGRILKLPDLSDQQRQTITNRDRQLQRQLLGLEEKALDARFALQDLAAQDAPDPQAVGRALQGVFDVRRQMVEATIAARNDVRQVLTEEQRETLESWGRGMGQQGMSGMRGRMMQQQ